MDFALDASVALAWLFEDEDEPLAEAAGAAMVGGAAVVVPRLWYAETANSILVGFRRGRFTADKAELFWSRLCELALEIDEQPPQTADFFGLAWQHELSAYDATYLDVARRFRCPLATLDRKLAEAAGRVGVKIFQP